MIFIILWVILYSLVVAASIYFLGSPTTLLGNLNLKNLLGLLFDWRFLLGGVLALIARFIFVIINNLASKEESLADAHLSITALATTASIVVVLIVNYCFLDERLSPIQIIGTAVILLGFFLIFR
jgi:drug/metabolite transporter (DMT)-like permease